MSADLENAEKYLQLFQNDENDNILDAWNNFLKVASIIQLQSIVRQFNLHTAIPRYTKLGRGELIKELADRIDIKKGRLVYKKIKPIDLKNKVKDITIYLKDIKKLYSKNYDLFEEKRKILKKDKRKLQKEIITPALNTLLTEILELPKKVKTQPKTNSKYPHDMFKNGVKQVAKTKAEHEKLTKQGYTHMKPKTPKTPKPKTPKVKEFSEPIVKDDADIINAFGRVKDMLNEIQPPSRREFFADTYNSIFKDYSINATGTNVLPRLINFEKLLTEFLMSEKKQTEQMRQPVIIRPTDKIFEEPKPKPKKPKLRIVKEFKKKPVEQMRQPVIIRPTDQFGNTTASLYNIMSADINENYVIDEWANTPYFTTALLQFDKPVWEGIDKLFDRLNNAALNDDEQNRYVVQNDMTAFTRKYNNRIIDKYGVEKWFDGIDRIGRDFASAYDFVSYVSNIGDQANYKTAKSANINQRNQKKIREYNTELFNKRNMTGGQLPTKSYVEKQVRNRLKELRILDALTEEEIMNIVNSSYNEIVKEEEAKTPTKSSVEEQVRTELQQADMLDTLTEEEIMNIVNSTYNQLVKTEEPKPQKRTKQIRTAKQSTKPKKDSKTIKLKTKIIPALKKLTRTELNTLAKYYNRNIPVNKYTRMSREDLITELAQMVFMIDNKIFSVGSPFLTDEVNSVVFKGDGYFDYFKNIVDRYRFNISSSKVLEKYGNDRIVLIQINRTPIYNSINRALNLISLGKWNKTRSEFNYDTLFHLSMTLTVQTKTGEYRPVLIEKNQQVSILDRPKMYDTTEIETINMKNSSLTVNELLQNTINHIGKQHFFTYDAFSFNCQDFIKNILISNNLYTDKLDKFVYQKLTNLIDNLPSYVPITSRIITDLASWIDRLRGAGMSY